MRKTFFTLIILILTSLYGQNQYGQNTSVKTKFYQKDFEKNKIDEETYQLWKYKFLNSSNIKDTLIPSFFVDDRNYKGVINYGVQFKSKDFKVFQLLESHRMWYLKVNFEKTVFNPKDSIIEIEGFVNGGWADSDSKKLKEKNIENRLDIFLGEKKDTIVHCYLGKVVNEELIEVKIKGRDVNESTILDTFPAFYFKNYSHYKTVSNGKRYFKIKGKVAANTILAFGDIGCYSEIFDLSTMIYNSKKNRRKKTIKKDLPAYKILIKDNIVLSDIQKDKIKNKEINYYSFTEEAENFILKRQYAKAKEQYNLLNKNYKVIFARDIHNAIRCALFSRDYENAYYWTAQLAKKGVGINYFNSKIFTLLKKQKQWNGFSVKYDSIYYQFQNSRNTKLKEGLEKLVEEDQADYGLANRKDSKVLYETTERVTDKLIALLKEEGYPSEEKIGVDTKNDTVLNPFPEYHVLIRHAIQQNPKNIEALNDLLIKSALKLEHDNKRSSIEKFYNNSCFHIYKGNLYNSKSCGLNDLDVRKMKFIFNNPYVFFYLYGKLYNN
ncbi:MAG TPA: hypothetical protein VLB74_08580 [Flavobacterium sp.]|uniref:hypothetical protein n=1 Tax=Flavobacterium sp. TaxID=239 RepID=UPI002CDB95A4|nr:hypothetical protein [Flavobacterium sp.]HSD14689.1 hypothetical protein [Flavobacterium sp.]